MKEFFLVAIGFVLGSAIGMHGLIHRLGPSGTWPDCDAQDPRRGINVCVSNSVLTRYVRKGRRTC